MPVHIKGGKPPVFSMSQLPDDVKFAQSLEEAFTPLIESGHLDAIAALGHPIKSAADLDAWSKLGPNVQTANKGKALKHPFTKAEKIKLQAAGKTGGKTITAVNVNPEVILTPAPKPSWPVHKPIPPGVAEKFIADNPDIFKPQVITNDPAKYVKNPAFDAEFQAKIKAEKQHVKLMKAFVEASPTTMDVSLPKKKGIKVKIKKPDGTTTTPVTVHVGKLNLDAQTETGVHSVYPSIDVVPKTKHEYDLVLFDEVQQQGQTVVPGENAEHTPESIKPLWHPVNKVIVGVDPGTGETTFVGEPQITMPESQYKEQITEALKNLQGVMLTQIASKFKVEPEAMAAATKELNDATKALTYHALYGGTLLDCKALIAEMGAGTHGTVANTSPSSWANKSSAEIMADIKSIKSGMGTPAPEPSIEGDIKTLGESIVEVLKGKYLSAADVKKYQFNFDMPGLDVPKPLTPADLDAFNQALQDHSHNTQDSDMIKNKGPAPAMAMEDLTAAKASEDQEPGLEFAVSTEEANSEVLELVDEYTTLQALIDAADVTHLIKKQDEIKKQLQSIAKSDQFPSHKPVQLWGTHENYVQFSEQKNMQKITDKPGLIDAIGMAKYMANTEITLANAKKLLSENELAKFTATSPGPRTLSAVVLGTLSAQGKT
jgi:hypothetical protein